MFSSRWVTFGKKKIGGGWRREFMALWFKISERTEMWWRKTENKLYVFFGSYSQHYSIRIKDKKTDSIYMHMWSLIKDVSLWCIYICSWAQTKGLFHSFFSLPRYTFTFMKAWNQQMRKSVLFFFYSFFHLWQQYNEIVKRRRLTKQWSNGNAWLLSLIDWATRIRLPFSSPDKTTARYSHTEQQTHKAAT